MWNDAPSRIVVHFERRKGKRRREDRKKGKEKRGACQSRIIKKAMGEGWVACRLCRGIFTALFLYLNIRVKSSERLPILFARRCFCTKYTEFSLLLRCSLFLHSCINIGQVDQVLRGIISQMNFRTVLLLAVFARDNDTANINTEPTSNFYKYLLNVLYQAFLTFPCMQYILINMYTRWQLKVVVTNNNK